MDHAQLMNFEPSNPKNISEFMQIADVTKQENGLWTVHCEGYGKPGKIYNTEGRNEYEAMENAWHVISDLGFEIGSKRSEVL